MLEGRRCRGTTFIYGEIVHLIPDRSIWSQGNGWQPGKPYLVQEPIHRGLNIN